MKLNWNPPKIKPVKAVYEWSADYAADVHEGGVKRADGSKTPARPWTDHALANNNLPQMIADVYAGDIEQAFRDMAEGMGDEFRLSINEPIWYWDRLTKRKNGDVVASPRDIVDTGNLERSQSLRFE